MINILMDGSKPGAPLTAAEYESLQRSDNGFLFESVTLEELEATYHYDHKLAPAPMLEAIVTTTSRLARTMAAFRRVFTQQLAGTDISVDEAEIARPRVSGGYATQTVRFQASDGQSVSIIFHSPSGDPAKIATGDTLVAFRFLLNKRDVTHTVSPDGGIDVSLKQVTLKLSNLLERNSKPFQSRQSAIKAQRDKLDTAQAELSTKDAEYNKVVADADAIEQAVNETSKRIETYNLAINKTEKRLQALRAKLKLLQKTDDKQPGDQAGGLDEQDTDLDTNSDIAEQVPNGSAGAIVHSVPLHSVKTSSMLNPAIKASATRKDNPNRIWYSQGKPNTMIITASFASDVDNEKAKQDKAQAIQYREALKMAKNDGYMLERYKHSRLQGIYVLVNADEMVLTENGWHDYWKAAAPNKQPAATGETETPYLYAIPATLDKAAAPKSDFIDWIEKDALPPEALEVFDAAIDNGHEFGGIGRYSKEIDDAVLLKYKMVDLQVPYDAAAHAPQEPQGEQVESPDSKLNAEFEKLYQEAQQLPGANMAIKEDDDGRYVDIDGTRFNIDSSNGLTAAIEYLNDWISQAPARAIKAKSDKLKSFIAGAKLPKGWELNKDELEDAEWPRVFIDSAIEAYSKDGNYSYSLSVNDADTVVISHTSGDNTKPVENIKEAIEFVQGQLNDDAAAFASAFTGSIDDLPEELAELVKPHMTQTNSDESMNSDDMAAKLRQALDTEKDADALMTLLETAVDTFEKEGTYTENEQLAELVSDRITELLEAAQ